MEIKPADVLLGRGRGIISRLIKWYTDSIYSHAAFILNENVIIEAHLIPGVRAVALDNIDYDYDIYRLNREISKEELEIMKEFAIKQLTRSYDLSQIFGYLIYGFGRGNKLNDPHELICSELVDLIYSSVNIDLLPEIELGNCTPDELSNSDKLIKVVEIKDK